MNLERSSGIPLYIQVARMVSRLIIDGTWPAGLKLPPERHMARILGVSRNTASACYRYLQERGLVTSCRGRGTHVSGRPVRGVADDVDRSLSLTPVIDVLLELAQAMGLGSAEVADLVAGRARVHARREPMLAVALIECNREQLDFFAQNLKLGPGVRIRTVLMADPIDADRLLAECAGVDLVVTTFFHLDDVRAVLAGRHEVVGIALDPDLETMVRIAQLPSDRPVGLVCLSAVFADRVQKSIDKAGLREFEIRVHTLGGPGDLESLLPGVGAVIVSPGRYLEVTRVAPEGVPVIEFVYCPDQGSTMMLNRRLAELSESARRREMQALESKEVGG